MPAPGRGGHCAGWKTRLTGAARSGFTLRTAFSNEDRSGAPGRPRTVQHNFPICARGDRIAMPGVFAGNGDGCLHRGLAGEKCAAEAGETRVEKRRARGPWNLRIAVKWLSERLVALEDQCGSSDGLGEPETTGTGSGVGATGAGGTATGVASAGSTAATGMSIRCCQ